jgi:hypothetical protein
MVWVMGGRTTIAVPVPEALRLQQCSGASLDKPPAAHEKPRAMAEGFP